MAYYFVDGYVTPSFTIPFEQGSGALGAQTVHIDVVHAPTLVFPAISSLGGTLNQVVTVTNQGGRANPTFQPAGTDTFSNNGTGVSLVGPSGAGYVRIFQPASAGFNGLNPTWSVTQG